jgi:TDG/mug DNA glycosylase family protein
MGHTVILPDYLTADLLVVFVGTAASDISARTGHYYANPANRFWQLLYHAGLTDRVLAPSEDRTLPRYGLGLTDVVKT